MEKIPNPRRRGFDTATGNHTESNTDWLVRRWKEMCDGDGLTITVAPAHTGSDGLAVLVKSDNLPAGQFTVDTSNGSARFSCGKEPTVESVTTALKKVISYYSDLRVDAINLAVVDLPSNLVNQVPRILGELRVEHGQFKKELEAYNGPAINLVCRDTQDSELWRRNLELARVSNAARLLAAIPYNHIGVDDMNSLIEALMAECGVDVVRPNAVERRRLGLISSVAKANGGNWHMPSVIIMPEGHTEGPFTTDTLVAKGIMFDGGGQSHKGQRARSMKGDMMGAAMALAVAWWAARNPGQLTRPLVITWCITDNHVGPLASMVDDVVMAFNGIAVEIENTDAEGRLVMASGIQWTPVYHEGKLVGFTIKGSRMFSLASLTGSSSVVAGENMLVNYAKGDDGVDELRERAVAAGLDVTFLETDGQATKMLCKETKIADIANSTSSPNLGPGKGDAFLRHFVPEDVAFYSCDIGTLVDFSEGLPKTSALNHFVAWLSNAA